ncbi:unnamed protein product [Phaeothamnion confervicola]
MSPTSPSRKRRHVVIEMLSDAGPSVALSFSKDFTASNENYRLLEVSQDLIDAIAAGDSCPFRFVGREDDDDGEVVLVTDSQTFKMTKVETSNTVLLVPPQDPEAADETNNDVPFQISAASTYQYEITRTTPSLDALTKTLNRAPYRGRDAEAGVKRSELYSLAALEALLQFSRAELICALRRLGAISIDGNWRLLESSYAENVLDRALDMIMEQDTPLDAIDTAAIAASLPQFEPEIVAHILQQYSVGGGGTGGGDSGSNGANATSPPRAKAAGACCALDLVKVARHRAHQLFRRRRERTDQELWPEDDFWSEWAASMPGVEAPELSALEGVGLRERGEAGVPVFRYLPAAGLPVEPSARMAALFALRPKWRLAELRPYLGELEAQGTKLADVLLQHTRASTDATTGERLFSAR